jgi:hypothetical protein
MIININLKIFPFKTELNYFLKGINRFLMCVNKSKKNLILSFKFEYTIDS